MVDLVTVELGREVGVGDELGCVCTKYITLKPEEEEVVCFLVVTPSTVRAGT